MNRTQELKVGVILLVGIVAVAAFFWVVLGAVTIGAGIAVVGFIVWRVGFPLIFARM